MIPEINYWAVLLATVAAIVIGSIWYTPKVLGDRWKRLAEVKPPATSVQAWLPIVVSIVLSFLLAWVLAGSVAIAWHFYGGSFLVSSLVTALTLWAGFTAGRIITHDVFSQQPVQLIVINVLYELLLVVVMALIIGVWPPAGTV
ncbi:MAG: hypothetical protein ABS63_02320 [Microbacterium sp. SCN 70-27]|uniref:DUF1761 domain-containing protein n=1 Tax=unclassified Microbacterium TaxID=2609290 RepID=UPI00086DCFCD|nr:MULTISPECIES: DUF1761 domain-containing protein [unclassified Microbacterium]MBN9223715.1 DUF1761 domain-containing protein [Microbacterium sp.]ODT28924.1 MAG: hypothetical protein ABS63_02320 [Microbacterium sp. SCN 70-27]